MINSGSFFLGSVLFLAGIFDLKDHKIPNVLTGTLFILGVVTHIMGLAPASHGVSLINFIEVFSIYLILYSLGVFGAGDVKLVSAVSLFLTTEQNVQLNGVAWVLTALYGFALLVYDRGIISWAKATYESALGLITPYLFPFVPRYTQIHRAPFGVMLLWAWIYLKFR